MVSLAFLLTSSACAGQKSFTSVLSEFNGRIELASARIKVPVAAEDADTPRTECDAFRCLTLVPSDITWVSSKDKLSIDWSKFTTDGVDDDDPATRLICNLCNLSEECPRGHGPVAFPGGIRPSVRLIDSIANTAIDPPFDFETGCEANASPNKRSGIKPISPPPGSSSLQLEPVFTGSPQTRSRLFNFETVSPGMPRVWYAYHPLDDRGVQNVGDTQNPFLVRQFTWNMCGDSLTTDCSHWHANFSPALEIVSIRVLQGQPVAGDPENLDPLTASPIHVYAIDARDIHARCFADFSMLDANHRPPFAVQIARCRNAFPVPQPDGTCTSSTEDGGLSIRRLTPGYQPGNNLVAYAWEVHFPQDGRCGVPMPDLTKGQLWLEFTIRVIE